MYILLVLILIIATFTIIFAIQNTTIVSVTFLSLKFESSLALILLIAFLLGVTIAMLFSLPYFYRYNKTIKNLSMHKKGAAANRTKEEKDHNSEGEILE